MFVSRPLSLFTLLFAFAIHASVAWESNVDDSDVTFAEIFAVDYPIVAYIHDSSRHATTYHIACPSDTHSTSCPFAQPYTLVQGPSTLSFEFTAPVSTAPATATSSSASPTLTQSFTFACDLEDTTSMACSATGLADADTPVTTSQTLYYTGAAAQAFFKEVQIVTKTADLLTYTPGATSSSAKATITGLTNGGVFFEGKKAEVGTTTSVATEIVVAEASGTPSATGKTSGAGRMEVSAGVVVFGLLGLGLL